MGIVGIFLNSRIAGKVSVWFFFSRQADKILTENHTNAALFPSDSVCKNIHLVFIFKHQNSIWDYSLVYGLQKYCDNEGERGLCHVPNGLRIWSQFLDEKGRDYSDWTESHSKGYRTRTKSLQWHNSLFGLYIVCNHALLIDLCRLNIILSLKN